MAAPLGLEPRKPASETGVLPIRLKGNIMAGSEGLEPPLAESKSAALTSCTNSQYRQGTFISRFNHLSNFHNAQKMGLEPMIY